MQGSPCRPAPWQMEAISAELSLSGLETSASKHQHAQSYTNDELGAIQNIQSSRSTSGLKFIFAVTVWKINLLSRLDGSGNSIFLSNRPGRSRAGSSVSCRLVAMIT